MFGKKSPRPHFFFFVNRNLKKGSSRTGFFLTKNSQTEHRLGGWRILMNYIQPNAGQTTHSIYTLIQDGAQYVPLKCRKARREFYWTKNNGGDWGIWMFLDASRVLFLLSLLFWKSARVLVLVRGKQWMLHMHMFIVKHRLFYTLLRPFTRFKKIHFKSFFVCVQIDLWELGPVLPWDLVLSELEKIFLCSTFHRDLSSCFLKH